MIPKSCVCSHTQNSSRSWSRDAGESGIPAASPVPDLIQSPRLTVELERVVNVEPHMNRLGVSRPDRQFYPFAASVIGGEKIATAKAQPLAIEHLPFPTETCAPTPIGRSSFKRRVPGLNIPGKLIGLQRLRMLLVPGIPKQNLSLFHAGHLVHVVCLKAVRKYLVVVQLSSTADQYGFAVLELGANDPVDSPLVVPRREPPDDGLLPGQLGQRFRSFPCVCPLVQACVALGGRSKSAILDTAFSVLGAQGSPFV